ncbi:MAG: helix-turn-helix domain-containing protein [Methanobacteriota archaeon]
MERTRVSAILLSTTSAVAILLYHRMRPEKTLEQRTRLRIYARLHERGYLVISEAARELGLARTTIVYHLAILAGSGLARSHSQGRLVIWVPTGTTNARGRPTILSRRCRDVLEAVELQPGDVLANYQRSTGMRKSLVHYHLQQLCREGLIERRVEAKRHRYYPRTWANGLLPAAALQP